MEFIEEAYRIVLKDGDTKIGEITWSSDNEHLIIVEHTHVNSDYAGNGYARQLVNHVVDRARRLDQKIIPLCSFVNSTFKRHPEEFEDVWKK